MSRRRPADHLPAPRPPDAGRRPPRIALAGLGRAGSALAVALARDAGWKVVAWDRRPARVASLVRRVPVERAPGPADLLRAAPWLLLAVRDEALAEFAGRLAELAGTGRPPRVVLHVAGSLPSTVLSPLRRGTRPALGVFHPVVSLAGPSSAGALPGAFATVSGDPAAVRVARRIARALGMRVLPVDDARRPLLHAGAVMAAGDLVALLSGAERLLGEAGIPPHRARRLLVTLARSALDNLATRGPRGALTGPAARNDRETIRRHLEAIAAARDLDPRIGDLHRLLLELSRDLLDAPPAPRRH